MLRTESQLYADFLERTPTSRKLAEQADHCFPSGLTHDGRYLDPYAIYVERSEGSRKWDVDGNEYVDYFGGHGALLLGHGHPQVVDAVDIPVLGAGSIVDGRGLAACLAFGAQGAWAPRVVRSYRSWRKGSQDSIKHIKNTKKTSFATAVQTQKKH